MVAKQYVLYTKEGSIGIVTLDRPEGWSTLPEDDATVIDRKQNT
jgi:hypothetical protein